MSLDNIAGTGPSIKQPIANIAQVGSPRKMQAKRLPSKLQRTVEIPEEQLSEDMKLALNLIQSKNKGTNWQLKPDLILSSGETGPISCNSIENNLGDYEINTQREPEQKGLQAISQSPVAEHFIQLKQPQYYQTNSIHLPEEKIFVRDI